ncbi:MAG: rane protein, partial [Thermoplasmata archaeon]|nr:rane protein [Thermoplasmata archaeon]
MQWRDTWTGALATALLLTVGKWLIGLYVGGSHVATAFGAAGSLAAILVWLYYTGLALFLGAEDTQVRAEMAGRPLVPKPHAYAVQAVPRDEAKQGTSAKGGRARHGQVDGAGGHAPPSEGDWRARLAPDRPLSVPQPLWPPGRWLGMARPPHPRRQQARDFVGAHPGLSFRELQRRLGWPLGSAQRHLARLVADGALVVR